MTSHQLPSEIKELLEEFGKLYQDYLSECDVYDGASLWGNKRCNEIAQELAAANKQGAQEERERMIAIIKQFDGYDCGKEGCKDQVRSILRVLSTSTEKGEK